MEKTTIFISHIKEEKELAIKLKEFIESNYLGMVDVFVSSDEHSISNGSRWLDNITNALKQCSIELILCSPTSIKRQWINFEAGAGWVRNIPVIPLCHSGMTFNDLPLPLNLLQAAMLDSVSNLKLIFPVISQAIGCMTPALDCDNLVAFVNEFQESYTFWNKINKGYVKLKKANSDIALALLEYSNVSVSLTETEANIIKRIIDEYFSDLIVMIPSEHTTMTPQGIYIGYQLSVLSKWQKIKEDPNFNK